MTDKKEKYLTGNKFLEKIQGKVELREKEIKELEIQLEQGVRTFKNEDRNQEAYVHPSSKKEGVYQFTFFDGFGPVGDFEAESIEKLATTINEYGFAPCKESDFSSSSLAEKPKVKMIKSNKSYGV